MATAMATAMAMIDDDECNGDGGGAWR